MAIVAEKYQAPIGVAVTAASAIGPAGIVFPAFDMAGIGVVWTTMVGAIADKSEHEFDRAAVAKLVTAALAAASGYALGSKILSWTLIAVFPFAGVPTAMAANAALNGLFTLKLGVATAKQFDRPDLTMWDKADLIRRIVGAVNPVPTLDEIAFLKALITQR